MSALFLRLIALVASALWLVGRAAAHAVRRRGSRVRRYAQPGPARPHVITGPIPLITPRTASGVEAPPLPVRPSLPWETAPVARFDVLACRRDQLRRAEEERPLTHARVDRSRLGLTVLLDLSAPVDQHEAVAA